LGKGLKNRPGWAGADEAGRGPLAGPVVAAAVLLPPGFRRGSIDDSKKLNAAQREKEATRIKKAAQWSVAVCEVDDIDRMNILRASLYAMHLAICDLGVCPDGVLIDGNMPAPDLPCACETVIDGDAKYLSIAAASIIAKVHRDSLMSEFACEYPEYGFERHFGYSTPEHFRALDEFGPCALHRRSFAPIRERLQPCLDLGV
jgi:ribonuclease HII